MRGATLWLSLALLTAGCGATVTHIGGPDASTPDVPTISFDAGPLAAPRPIAPLSTATVTAQNPTLHWSLAPGTDGARLQICHDRACTTIEQTVDTTGTHAPVPTALAPGVHFWRIAARMGTVVGTTWSPTWEFFVGHRSAPVDTSYGTIADFNGDGYADAIVGGTNATYVYYGAATGVNTTPTILTGPTTDGGTTVAISASAGDVNGDGFADLIVGNGSSASLYLGGANGLATTATTTLHSPHVDYPFGDPVSSAGDVNGDGYADVVVSGAVSRGSVAANAYVYLGGSGGLTPSPIALTQPVGGALGAPMANAGDINGDGYGDLIVSGLGVGDAVDTAYVYLGGTGWMTSPPIALPAPDGVTGFGISVAGAGDLNGDGYCDVVVGSDFGGVAVFTGAANGPTVSPTALNVGLPGESQVAGAGDINGDGFDDLVVSANGAIIFYAGQPGSLPLTGTSMNDGGSSLAGAGDVNGDGFADVIVGAYGGGAASIYLGAASSPGITPINLTNAGDPSFGDWVATALTPSAMTTCRRDHCLHPPRFAATMRPCVGQALGFRWHC